MKTVGSFLGEPYTRPLSGPCRWAAGRKETILFSLLPLFPTLLMEGRVILGLEEIKLWGSGSQAIDKNAFSL